MNRTLQPLLAVDRQQVKVSGSFKPNGSSALVAANTKGQGFTAARTGVGTFTVTLTEPVADVIGAIATLSLGTPANSMVQVTGWTLTNGRYVVTLTTLAAGSAADVASATNNIVSFEVTVQHSGSKPY